VRVITSIDEAIEAVGQELGVSNGFPSIRNASTRSPTPPATTSGSTSTLSEPALKVLIAQRSRTGS